MARRHYTCEILQAEADRYCDGLKARGFVVPACGIRVYTVGALHDAAIGAPPGFSARYPAVGGRSKDGGMTVYVDPTSGPFAPSPLLLLKELIYFHVTDPTALSAKTSTLAAPDIAQYDGGVAFVLERNYAYEAAVKALRLARDAELEPARLDDPWQTDPTALTRWEQLYERELYPQDHIPDELPERHSQRRRSNATRSRLVREDTNELPDKENMMPKPAKKNATTKKQPAAKMATKAPTKIPAKKAPAKTPTKTSGPKTTDEKKRLERNAKLRAWRKANKERVDLYMKTWREKRKAKSALSAKPAPKTTTAKKPKKVGAA